MVGRCAVARRPDDRHQPPHMGPDHAGRVPAMRGRGARIPGWHAHEVVEALRHFAGAKEAVRDVAALMQAASTDPVVAEQRHLEVLAASLYPHVAGGAEALAQAIRFVRHAAALAALGEEPQRPAAPLSVIPGAPVRPPAVADGGS